MEVGRFNVLFKEIFQEDYDHVKNYLIDYINYDDDGGNGSISNGGDTDDDEDYNETTIMVMRMLIHFESKTLIIIN